MMAIRMVWIISRYYNAEENMMGLLEKIANLIAQKVSQFIDHHKILSYSAEEAKRKIEQGRTSPDGHPQGVVVWDVQVTNQEDELVASYDILTLVAKKPE